MNMLRDEIGAGRLQREELHPLSRLDRPQQRLVEERALAAAGRPLLAGAEVVDEAERDVSHRRPFGDRDREREERDSPLGVDRAVDRVDDDHVGRCLDARRADAELLGHEREVRTRGVEPLDDDPLGGGVDRRRVVPALADADYLLTLGTRRQLGEHAVDVLDRGPARSQPVGHKGRKSSPDGSLG